MLVQSSTSAIAALFVSAFVLGVAEADTTPTDTVQEAYPPALRGDDACGPDDPDCNVCMRDVPGTFARLGTTSKTRDTLRATIARRTVGRRMGLRHYQSIVSFTAADGTEYLALSRSARRPGRGRIEFVRLPVKGERAHPLRRLGRFGPGKLEHVVRVPHGNHPGGMQVLGDVLAVAVECDGRRCKGPARVLFYDVSDPASVKAPMTSIVLDGSQGEPRQLGRASKASSVALTKLVDGRFLVYVGGRHSGRYGHFYVSDGPRLDAGTRFDFVHYWSALKDDPERRIDPLLGVCTAREGGVCKEWDRYENTTFVTECGTGRIYLVGMGERRGKVALHRLRARDRALDFESVARKRVATSRTSFGVSLRNGGGIRVRPDGSGFDLFIADRFPRQRGGLLFYQYGSDDPGPES
ncbi:MAG: hypothetical protein GXY23_00875 [Myxococcales bacterium]|nr:hypothetical protein [Myxococcales bacterium]